mmetsp:Transcript_18082/g.50189  ORF Transcript_18082/g.50189 Transcript_18082/m.50189 type:complete len:82 (-) Transcript_18082:541-786(-)
MARTCTLGVKELRPGVCQSLLGPIVFDAGWNQFPSLHDLLCCAINVWLCGRQGIVPTLPGTTTSGWLGRAPVTNKPSASSR